jgi:hypothetical protein
MGFIDRILKQIFPDNTAPNQVILHEVIFRSEKEKLEYQKWKAEGQAAYWLGELAKAYHFTKLEMSPRFQVHILELPYSNGFAIDYSDEIGKSNFIFLFDYLKEKIMALDYHPSGSDRKMIRKNEVVEMREKHYLKPKPGNNPEQANQRYGNVLIEWIAFNDKPDRLKLVANIYQDRQFTSAKGFDELIHAIFSQG